MMIAKPYRLMIGFSFAIVIVAVVVYIADKSPRLVESTPTKIVETISPQKAVIMIGGDVMLDRNVRKMGEKIGYDKLLASVAELFRGADATIVNLEGPITENVSKTLLPDGRTTGSFSFTFATATTHVISAANIHAVSLANNHTDNFGAHGLIETKKWLDTVGVGYFGSPWNSTSTELVMDVNGISIGLIGYHQFRSGISGILDDVARLSLLVDYLIIMPHWGEEYHTQHSPFMKEMAQSFLDAGADAVIGTHPHVVMDMEWVGDSPVIYSLGNLIFDQYFSPEVMKGNIAALYIEKVGAMTRLEKVRIYETHIDKQSIVTVDVNKAFDFSPFF
jgi:poly-gamma-glutamate synthesis protein (capsule biosynthesis protein)